MAAPFAVRSATKPFPRIAAGHVRRDTDVSAGELRQALDLAAVIKAGPRRYSSALAGQYISLLFEKPSLRTRMTFELAIKQLGGDCVVDCGPIGAREPLEDVARNVARWTQAIVARTFAQSTIDGLAYWGGIPVINALSDLYHPCQALADMLTLEERLGDVRGRKLAFVGDGNNVAHSLLLAATRLGMDVAIATPENYGPCDEIVQQAAGFAQESGATVAITNDPYKAVAGADAVYTDVWTSMGQENEKQARLTIFAPYQVNDSLMEAAGAGALFMHCLPAHRGEETTADVIESAASVVFDQAENRLHVQKALLLMLLAG